MCNRVPGAATGAAVFKELDVVVLTRDLPELGLALGDVGAIVYVYAEGNAYEVEFVTAEGRTIGVVTLTDDDIRTFSGSEILHARALTPA